MLAGPATPVLCNRRLALILRCSAKSALLEISMHIAMTIHFEKWLLRLRGRGVRHLGHVDELLMMRRATRPTTVIEDWIGEARLFFEELVK